jgi:4'-phosphopantetheinyl transferase
VLPGGPIKCWCAGGSHRRLYSTRSSRRRLLSVRVVSMCGCIRGGDTLPLREQAPGACPQSRQQDEPGVDVAQFAESDDTPGILYPDLRVWRLPASETAPLLEHAPLLLAASDIAAANRLGPLRLQRRHLAARILLRLALSERVGGVFPPAAWRFSRNPWGKPAVQRGQPPVHFSITHGKSGTLIAVSAERPVGIDMAELDQEIGIELFEIASPAERGWLDRRAGSARNETYVQLWTLKEAFTKLLGYGFALDPRKLTFALRPPGILNPASARQVQLFTWRAALGTRDFLASLALMPPSLPSPPKEHSPDTLISGTCFPTQGAA